MTSIPVIEGEADFNPPGAGQPCKTWYTIFGDLKAGKRPLICLHGGPGVPHNYLLPIKNLVTTHGIPVILYVLLFSALVLYSCPRNPPKRTFSFSVFQFCVSHISNNNMLKV